jgi:glutamate racemase
MNNTKQGAVGVIAGTPIDTQFGKKFLEKITNSEIFDFAVSKNPQEQNILQLNNPTLLFEICLNKILEFKEKNVTKILIYCNSLASVLNILKLKKITGLEIITPLDVYKNISKEYQNILIIAANSTGSVLPEKIIREHNTTTKIVTIGYLNLVNDIEKQLPPASIIKERGLCEILNFSKYITIDLIILACTHYPYVSKELQELTNIKILDLDQELKNILEQSIILR